MHRLDRAVNEGNLENHFTALPIRRSDDQHIVITRTNISITQPTRTRRRGSASIGFCSDTVRIADFLSISLLECPNPKTPTPSFPAHETTRCAGYQPVPVQQSE